MSDPNPIEVAFGFPDIPYMSHIRPIVIPFLLKEWDNFGVILW
jgi:hypothetical protein